MIKLVSERQITTTVREELDLTLDELEQLTII
jgi:hypothetical protein